MTELKRALKALALLTFVTGVLYPLLVTGLAQLLFARQANGSVITRNGEAVGSQLIGQYFDADKYLWGRPSATAPVPYNGAASGASNLGPSNPALVSAVAERVAKLRGASNGPVPVDLVTSSASGLDPDLSPAAATYQVARIAKARGLPANNVEKIIVEHTKPRTLGFLGEPTVNVLAVNLALDALAATGGAVP